MINNIILIIVEMSDLSLFGWQCVYVLSMYLGTFVSYLIPIVLITRQQKQEQSTGNSKHSGLSNNVKTQRILSICNCLSAGIFIGICFLNLIPYVDEEFQMLFNEAKYQVMFPIGMFTTILGLFLVLVLETLVMGCRSNSSNPVLHLDEEEELSHDFHNDEQTQELLSATHNISDKESNNEFIVSNNCNNGSTVQSHSHSHYHSHSHNSFHSHSHDFNIENTSKSSISFFILMFATSVHSVFEGLALGLQKDATKAMHLFIGILIHECLVAFALGLNSARNECSVKTNVKFSVVFSLTIPIGIVMGVVLGITPGLVGRSISALFQGLAAGTFIHVTFHELIPSEFLMDTSDGSDNSNHKQKLFKIFLLFMGFMFMALMTLFTSDSH
ncbi:zinc transporter ZIP3-like [Oppia nitens]|uniref:zinc transporter ZIP3-like n=1 Tax=Oppia nitens TaxID=1686743 RepID=UPI0023DACFC2|nr:zinc transporter ZIP3-like [Oppia nitens]